MSDDNDPWRVAFETPWFRIEEKMTVLPGHAGPEPYYRIAQPNTVMAIVVTAAGELVVVRQYRPAVGAKTLELPAGICDPGETPEQSIRREILEETGFDVPRLDYLGEGNFMLNRAGWSDFLFLARDAVRREGFVPEPGIEVLLFPPAALAEAVVKGEFYSLSGLCAFKLAELRYGIDLFAGHRLNTEGSNP
ncbi:NUDIX hydrolase [Magnetospira thiophila]